MVRLTDVTAGSSSPCTVLTWEFDPVGGWPCVNSGRCNNHRHNSRYLKFQGILEFVGHQLIASSMTFSEPPTRRRTMCLSVANVFWVVVV